MVAPESPSAMIVEGTRRGRIFWHGTVEALAEAHGADAVVTGYEDGTEYEGVQPKRVLADKRREERKEEREQKEAEKQAALEQAALEQAAKDEAEKKALEDAKGSNIHHGEQHTGGQTEHNPGT